jgi:hypothetical protein
VHLPIAWAQGAASDGTHEKGGQYDCEHNFTSIPERICSEDEDRLRRLRESLGQLKMTNCSTPTLWNTCTLHTMMTNYLKVQNCGDKLRNCSHASIWICQNKIVQVQVPCKDRTLVRTLLLHLLIRLPIPSSQSRIQQSRYLRMRLHRPRSPLPMTLLV